MAYLVDIIPFWGIVLILFLISITIYVTFSMFFAKYLPHFMQNPDHSQVASGLIQIISLFYAVLLGFLIVILWQNFDKLQMTTNSEATALATIVRSSVVFPAESQMKIHNAVQNYLNFVLNYEWQRMKRAEKISDKYAEDTLSQLFYSILFLEPKSSNQENVYKNMVTQLDSVLEARRARIDTIHYQFPAPMIIILLIGAILIVVFLPTIAGLSTTDYQHFLKISICCCLVTNLAVLLSLKYPFSGKYSISDGSFREGILREFNIPNKPFT